MKAVFSSLLAAAWCAASLACAPSYALEPSLESPSSLGQEITEAPPETLAVAQRLLAVQSLHARIVVSISNGADHEATVDFALPDRARLQVPLSGPSSAIELITVGQRLFERFGSRWYDITRPKQANAVLPAFTRTETVLSESAVLFRGAMSNVDGVPCQVYSLLIRRGPRQSLPLGVEELCVSDSMIRRLVWRSPGLIITTFLIYDADVQIPDPT